MHKSKTLCLSAMFIGALLPSTAVATTIYTITANTSSISGQDGFLDLQFEPGPGATNLATASVTAFSTDGTLTGAATLTGDVTGQLPSTVAFDNGTVFNDYFQETTFGSTETFKVALNGPTPLGGSASAFNISFYAADGSTPLLTNSPDGEAGQIFLAGNGTTSVKTYPTTGGGSSVLIITPVTAVAPEPGTIALFGAGFAALGFYRLRRK